jgi:hypothetical protein
MRHDREQVSWQAGSVPFHWFFKTLPKGTWKGVGAFKENELLNMNF